MHKVHGIPQKRHFRTLSKFKRLQLICADYLSFSNYCLEFSGGRFGLKMESVRPFWGILVFDRVWTWAWPLRRPWGRWQLPPPLIWRMACRTASVPILVHLSGAQSISLSALLLAL